MERISSWKKLQLYDIQRFTHFWMGLIFFSMFFICFFFFRIQKKCCSPSRPHPFLTTLPIINFNIELCFYATCHYSNSNYFISSLCFFVCVLLLLLLLLLTFSFTFSFPFPSFNITRSERKSCVEWLFLAGSLCVRRI